MISSGFREKILHAPKDPGCYIWKNSKGRVLYIGKAVNLYKRVNSYILNYERLDPKIKSMIDQVSDIDYFTVDSEVEALILETNLIKKYRPKYNRLMKDDKNYTWIKVDWYSDFPSIKLVREKNDKKAEYFGPYPARFPIQNVLDKMRKLFPYCNFLPPNINSKISNKKFYDKPCFDFHIGLCSGICANLVSKRQHRINIKSIRDFLKGKKNDIIKSQREMMRQYARDLKFEKAQELKELISDFEYTTQQIRIKSYVDENILEEIKKERIEKAFDQLRDKLSLDIKIQSRIECYDISNIQGKYAVGSMVVLLNGNPEKSLYRKFRVETKSSPDDFAMMQEILRRRLRYIGKENTKNKSLVKKPDLIIVDGGKGQLSSSFQVIEKMKINLPVIGLAKREEEIFKISRNKDSELVFEKVLLARRSEAMYLVQRIRDESHRFAIGYHRLIRSKGQTKSILDDIPGVGKIVKTRLIKAFGNINNIKKASVEELNSVVKNHKTVNAICKVLQK